VAQRWFVARRGLVTGVLTAGSATGQLVFLPVAAWLVETVGWRAASLVIAGAALAVVPLVLLLRDSPSDLGVQPYGAPPVTALPMGPAEPPVIAHCTSGSHPDGASGPGRVSRPGRAWPGASGAARAA
jgi:MFS family permease